ncbi:uncharacterized protein LOC121833097 [Ixodes scapularis]|uniref:uncharacterized protein LOC121833097 n=1 Tax=Ixodes scapularis TaxID=6945 RepID=UPI001C382965|nr:uncharacterized protein LOC121833097 [Ixodes scapularis]
MRTTNADQLAKEITEAGGGACITARSQDRWFESPQAAVDGELRALPRRRVFLKRSAFTCDHGGRPRTRGLLDEPQSGGVLVWAVPCYSLVLMVMVWRGVSRVRLFGDLWTWTRLCSCIGAVLFAVSDAMLALDAFYLSASPAYARHAVMFTYYAAQLGIALSVVDSRTMAALSVASEAPCRPATCCPGARTPAPRLGQ